MIYPSVKQYREAIASASDNLNKLNYLQPVLDNTNKPYLITGGFAVVFKMQDSEGNLYALKCFTKEQKGREEAYKKIASELDYDDSGYMTNFDYYEKELFVDCGDDSVDVPVVFMDWVEGVTLDKYIAQNINTNLNELVYRFSLLTRWLLNATFAHGDIKPDNIIVKPDGKLVLVDYDSMFVPSMAGEQARDQGTPGYSHPLRSTMPFDKHIDDFPLLLILFSLKAIALQPSLKASGDRIVFSAEDLSNPIQSSIFPKLQPLLADAEAMKCFSLLGVALSQGNLDGIDDKLTHLKKPEKIASKPPLRTNNSRPLTFNVNGVSFNMVFVEHGSFTMGATPEMEKPREDEQPAHKVTITKDYYMGETQVTQALWQAVMGGCPSRFKGENNPVECVSWDDCQEFIKKLNAKTGKLFRLPTEAEWEYAARGGAKSRHTQFAGSSNIDEVAWYDDDNSSNTSIYDALDSLFNDNLSNKTHPVAQKKSNELGLYDMSGNVWEWCNDWYNEDYYEQSPEIDPLGPATGSYRVLRGGCWCDFAGDCRLSTRSRVYPDYGFNNLGFRLCLQLDEDVLSFVINGVSFNMRLVRAGSFIMGATPEMDDPYADEKPAHKVTITKDYYMGETQVTQALWQAVMGGNPSRFKGENNPVECVSWDDCQEFIKKLNAKTGKQFRLPTEAEWEYAARGGAKSRHTQYAGSSNIDEVAWYDDNSSNKTHPVAQKKSNELGLYDMSGNVLEWCNDWYGSGYYKQSPEKDPQGPTTGDFHVSRGGCCNSDACSDARSCRLSSRDVGLIISLTYDIIGFRLCLQS